MHKNKKLYIKIHRNMHKNQKNHLLSQIKPCILNPFVSAQLLREISLLSNPSKTPALGKASVSKAEPSTAAFETRRRNIHWIFL